jgi:hypothetical protein
MTTHSGEHSASAASAGPILYARGADSNGVHLAVLMIGPDDWEPPALVPEGDRLVAPAQLARDFGWTVWRYDFVLPRQRGGATYALDDRVWRVQTDLDDPRLRIVYTSCNGQEADDLFQPRPDRNAMWTRLLAEHENRPFALLLQGGDQLYADDVWHCHPEVATWHDKPRDARRQLALSEAGYHAIRKFYWSHYIQLWAQREVAPLLAEVPSLMMWDDHDIFDGWGSHAPADQASPVWQGIYRAAREAFALFQIGASADNLPAMCDDGRAGFSWACPYGDIAVVAPDLRSERTPDQVMGDGGWAAMARWRDRLKDCAQVFVMSSVPALGPRLSWVERMVHVLPIAQKYEDDLRDQWQSRAHRAEWQRFLRYWLDLHDNGTGITVLSGEIHLATRGVMNGGSAPLHQLVASGIAHPAPPRAYARALGGLASLGESPLPDHPISLHPLPGRSTIYTAERNYLILERAESRWQAWWETETGGKTDLLTLD